MDIQLAKTPARVPDITGSDDTIADIRFFPPLERMKTAASIHILAGCVALALAMFYLLSDTLSFEFPGALLAQRPRMLVTACFGFAAYCLLFSAPRRELMAYKILGYGSIGLGLAVVWLIFKGMEIGAH